MSIAIYLLDGYVKLDVTGVGYVLAPGFTFFLAFIIIIIIAHTKNIN